MSMQFRFLGPEDLEAVFRIAKDTLVPLWSEKEYGYFLSHPQAYNLGGFKENQVLSCFVLTLKAIREIDIVSVACCKEDQRKGLASQLVRHLLKEAECDRAVLEVDLENEPAIKLYLKNGFSVVGRRKKYYQGKRDAWIMAWGVPR